MKKQSLATRSISLLLASSVMMYSCVGTTMIHSSPAEAKLYLNGEPVGTTPYKHSDTRIVGSTTTVKLEKEGYETLHASFSRDEAADVGAIIGGIFFLFPFLWTMKYKPEHRYEMVPSGEKKLEVSESSNTKAEKLRELKKLLDDKIITQEEFDKEKKRILEEEN